MKPCRSEWGLHLQEDTYGGCTRFWWSLFDAETSPNNQTKVFIRITQHLIVIGENLATHLLVVSVVRPAGDKRLWCCAPGGWPSADHQSLERPRRDASAAWMVGSYKDNCFRGLVSPATFFYLYDFHGACTGTSAVHTAAVRPVCAHNVLKRGKGSSYLFIPTTINIENWN